MLLNLLPQDLDLSFFVAVSVWVEYPAELQSDRALDLPFVEHFVSKFKFLFFRDVVVKEKLEEGCGTFGLFSSELGEVGGQHLKVRPLLIINPFLFLLLQRLSDLFKVLFAEYEPGLLSAITRP